MLCLLRLRHFIIVDQLELRFKPGFTVLTGETGAGKSILVDALALLLGERGDASVVRSGCDRAELEAEFDTQKLPDFNQWLDQNELAGDAGVCLLRRTIEAEGRSRAFINGYSVTLQQLKEASEFLVDIHSQHAHQSLLKISNQRRLLDAFAGQQALAQQLKEAWSAWQACRKKQLAWQSEMAAIEAEREQLHLQIQELEKLHLSEESWAALQVEHHRLTHAATLLQGIQASLDQLSETDYACLTLLNKATHHVNELSSIDPNLSEIGGLLENAAIQLQEAVYGLRHYLQHNELDPVRLTEVEQQLEAIYDMARKYRVKPDAIPALLAQSSHRLSQLAAMDSQSLAQQEQITAQHYVELAKQLSTYRQQTAQQLAQQITESMQALAMVGGQFNIQLTPLTEPTAYGLEHIEFFVSSHTGIPLAPLNKVASGGELSRISLALQVALNKVAVVPTLIFDEVDVGIGGGVAEIVGRLLKQLGNSHQVLCITHLPQVAACGNQQWQVIKQTQNGSVRSEIRELSQDNRIDEIARMLGGIEITVTTRAHAAEMLGLSNQ